MASAFLVVASNLNPVCGDAGADVAADCSDSWDRLWDIRWKVCSDPEKFGFNGQTSLKTIFVQNADCPGRGILFGSNKNGHLRHCYEATRVVLESCLQTSTCQGDCYASGTVVTKGGG
ncbi:hypothetical protein CBS101457_001434 [Exobasidium rhododendri]|nr:hypothetical protein CBS101457_001434 [Exobasidium rhododendri]